MPKIKKTNTEKQIFFPASLVAPVRVFLKDQLERLKSNRKKIDESDPFKNESRVEDSVALDTDRLMAYPEATKCINCERKSHRK